MEEVTVKFGECGKLNISEILLLIKDEYSLTDSDIARICRISVGTYKRIEKDGGSFDVLFPLCKSAGLDVHFALDFKKE